MSKRAHISMEVKLATALLQLRDPATGEPLIPYEHAKLMTAAQIISLFEHHHNILHSDGGPDEPWNMEWMLYVAHRERTAKIDVPNAAKGKRIRKRLAQAREALEIFLETGVKPPLPRRSRPIPKRANPWPPKGSRKLRSRSSFERRVP